MIDKRGSGVWNIILTLLRTAMHAVYICYISGSDAHQRLQPVIDKAVPVLDALEDGASLTHGNGSHPEAICTIELSMQLVQSLRAFQPLRAY